MKIDWISVDDRLPDEETRVIIAAMYMGGVIIDIDCIAGGKWDDYRLQKVTHWIPLPELPEVERA